MTLFTLKRISFRLRKTETQKIANLFGSSWTIKTNRTEEKNHTKILKYDDEKRENTKHTKAPKMFPHATCMCVKKRENNCQNRTASAASASQWTLYNCTGHVKIDFVRRSVNVSCTQQMGQPHCNRQVSEKKKFKRTKWIEFCSWVENFPSQNFLFPAHSSIHTVVDGCWLFPCKAPPNYGSRHASGIFTSLRRIFHKSLAIVTSCFPTDAIAIKGNGARWMVCVCDWKPMGRN